MKKFKDSALFSAITAVLPISILILIVNAFLPEKIGGYDIVCFIIGNVLLIGGMALYNTGIDISLSPIGEQFGEYLTKKKNVPLILIAGLILGFIITIAEPDLSVLGEQLGNIKILIIVTIAVGVGLFLAIALLRILLKWNFVLLIMILYAAVFILALFVENKYIPLCFDSGGVTTGAITVPFILAFGASVAGMVGGKNRDENSFGMIATCSIGPIFMMLLLCMIFKPEVDTAIEYTTVSSVVGLASSFFSNLLKFLKEVAIALAPIAVAFYLFNFISFKTPKIKLTRISLGLLYTYIGLTLFLTGVNAAYMGTGYYIGKSLAATEYAWVLIPVGALVGLLIVLAEPAIGVLVKQVEAISAGTIKKRTMRIALCISMAFAVGFSMMRIIFDISIWFVIGIGYIIALGISFFVPKVYTSIAFDSGGVASGPMTATFLLPLAIGAAEGFGVSVLDFAYGLVATVALMPLITIQLLGLTAQIVEKRSRRKNAQLEKIASEDIIEFNE